MTFNISGGGGLTRSVADTLYDPRGSAVGTGLTKTQGDGYWFPLNSTRLDGYETSTHATATYATRVSFLNMTQSQIKTALDGYALTGAGGSGFTNAQISPILDGYLQLNGADTMTGRLIMGNVVSPTVSSASTVAMTHDSTKSVSLQISYDGYNYYDSFTGFGRIKNADSVISTTVLADDAHLTFTVDANSRYIIDAFIDGYTSNSAGYKFDFNGTATAANLNVAVLSFTDQFTSFEIKHITALATSIGSTGGSPSNFDFRFQGSLTTTAGGSFNLRTAANAAGTITYKKGSYMRLLKI